LRLYTKFIWGDLLAALGVKTSFMQLAQAGWWPFALLLVETLWMAGFVLVAILLSN
jgi:uncharacterized membrane protein YadS